MDKTITLIINDKEHVFTVTLTAYNACVDALEANNKTAPMYQFLQRCADDKKAVKALYEQGLVPDVFGALIAEYKPVVTITVKK